MKKSESLIPKLKVPEFTASIPDYMVDSISDDSTKFLIEQISIIKQQNKWQSDHIAEVFDYTRHINGKVIELEKYRQQQEIEKTISKEIQNKSITNKRTLTIAGTVISLVLYPLYISYFINNGPATLFEALNLIK